GEAGGGAPGMAGGEPVGAAGEAGCGVDVQDQVGVGDGEVAAVEVSDGPAGACVQEPVAVGKAGGVGERGDPVAVAEHRSGPAGGDGVPVLGQPVGLVRGVVGDRRVVADRDRYSDGGGVLAD